MLKADADHVKFLMKKKKWEEMTPENWKMVIQMNADLFREPLRVAGADGIVRTKEMIDFKNWSPEKIVKKLKEKRWG